MSVDCNHISPGTESQGHTGQLSRAGVDVRISKDSNDTTRDAVRALKS